MSTSPIIITPSTSVVLVNTADYAGNPVVLLPNLAGPGALGRVITIRDNDGGAVDPSKSIYLSTTGGALFQSELSSITLSSFRINQPYGFITITPRLNDGFGNTSYGLMNVYAFPEASPAAYVNTFNTNFGYISTLSTMNLQVNQDTYLKGNLTVNGGITYVNPGATTLDIGRVNANLISVGSVLNSNFYGVNVAASTINTSSFVVRDSGSVLLPNAGSWATAFSGGVDPNSLTLGNPGASAGAQIGVSSNFFGLRSFSKSGPNFYSTSVVMRDGTVGVNVGGLGDIGDTTGTSNYSMYVRGALQLSNLGINNNIGMLKTTEVNSSFVEVVRFGPSISSNYRIDASSNIAEGFFGGGGFANRYNWLTVDKNGSIKFWTGSSGTTERVTIDNAGRVGIGTTTPPHPLSVNGNIRMMSNNSLIYGTATDCNQQASLNLCSNDNKTYLNYGSGGQFTVRDNNGSQRFAIYNNSAGFTQYDTDTSGAAIGLNLENSPSGKSIRFHTNLRAGDFNSITQAGDSGIIFTNGASDTGNLVIAPWTSVPAKGLRMDSNGCVAIGTGTPNPNYKLTIDSTGLSGALNLDGTTAAVIDNGRIRGLNGSAGVPTYTFLNDEDTGIFGTGSNQLGITIGGIERIRVDSNGAFGVGTTTPSSFVNIAGGEDRANSNFPHLSLRGGNYATGRGNFWISGGGFGQKMFMQAYIGVANDISNTPSDIIMNPFGGNIGIGNSNPVYTLDVSGQSRFSQHIVLNNGQNLRAKNSSGTDENVFWPREVDNNTYLNYGSGGSLNIRNNSSAAKMKITDTTTSMYFGETNTSGNLVATTFASDNITIGSGRTTNNYAYIDLVGDSNYHDYGSRLLRGPGGSNTWTELSHRGTGPLELWVRDAGDMNFYTTSDLRMKITSGGTVGINNTSPNASYKLDVTGAGHFTGNLVVDGTITGTLNFVPAGCIMMWSTTSAPTGWLFCDGSSVLRGTYGALFNAIGTTYGSLDGSTFNLPDMRDRFTVGAGSTYSLNNKGGNDTINLTSNQMPAHTHTGTADTNGSHTHSVSTENGSNAFNTAANSGSSGTAPRWGAGDTYVHNMGYYPIFTAAANGSHSHNLTINSAGAGASIDIRPKYIGIYYIIKF
jgi:microcystin-dependent protein